MSVLRDVGAWARRVGDGMWGHHGEMHDDEMRELLRRVRSIAVVGMSDHPMRASHSVARYLVATGEYRVHFVNPRLTQVFGQPVYPSLDRLPEVPDLVDVFRRAEHVPEIADQAIAIGSRALWLQLGLADDAVARHVVDAGLDVVMDRCLKVEHARLLR